jgi:hypothetical protein
MGQANPEIICGWEKPKQVCIHEMKELFRQGKTAAPRILIFTAGLLLIVHHFLNAVLPDDFGASFSRAFIGVFVIAVWGVCSFYVIRPLIYGYSRCTYKITDKGIYATGGPRPWHLAWGMMQGYFISPHDEISGIRILSIRTASTVRELYLPESELADNIASLVAEKVRRLERIPESLRKMRLSEARYAWLLVLTIIFSVSAAYCIITCPCPYIVGLILFAIMLFGPGTLGLALLHGRRFLKNRYLLSYAITFNMAAVAVTIMLTIMFFIYHLSKQIEQP